MNAKGTRCTLPYHHYTIGVDDHCEHLITHYLFVSIIVEKNASTTAIDCYDSSVKYIYYDGLKEIRQVSDDRYTWELNKKIQLYNILQVVHPSSHLPEKSRWALQAEEDFINQWSDNNQPTVQLVNLYCCCRINDILPIYPFTLQLSNLAWKFLT